MASLQEETPARNMDGEAEARALRVSEAVARIVGRRDSAPPSAGPDKDRAPSRPGPDRGLEAARERWRRTFEARGPREPEPERLPLERPPAKREIVKEQSARPVIAAKPEPIIRHAAAAVVVGDRRLSLASRCLLVALSWRYRPGRPWRGSLNALCPVVGVTERAARRAIQEAMAAGHLVRIGRNLWWPAVEDATGTNWRPAEQLALPLVETGDQSAFDYLASRTRKPDS